MANTRLSQYKGELDSSQIAAGINAAQRNARRLADDAEYLLQGDRIPTALAISILSIEESGKVSILRGLAMTKDPKRRRDVWKDYRSHRSKNVNWILPELVASGAKDLESLRLATDTSAEHTALLDQLKQLSLYTDCLGKGNWSEPSVVIEHRLTKALVSIADLFANKSPVTVEEIDLWKKHMRPVYGAPLPVMKAALLDWFREMKKLGLWSDGDISAEEFIVGPSH